MRENQIEQYLIKCVKEAGGEVRKVKWIGRRGAPDRLVMLPFSSIWVELKAPGEKCKSHQLREHVRLLAAGMRVDVIDSMEKVDNLIELEMPFV